VFMHTSWKANYTKILEKNNIENTSKQLIDIIR
jgi:hypothetical protein